MRISHDPFARQELHKIRAQAHVEAKGCNWCGGVSARGWLWVYETRPDDSSRRFAHRGAFCCKDCHDSYHQV